MYLSRKNLGFRCSLPGDGQKLQDRKGQVWGLRPFLICNMPHLLHLANYILPNAPTNIHPTWQTPFTNWCWHTSTERQGSVFLSHKSGLNFAPAFTNRMQQKWCSVPSKLGHRWYDFILALSSSYLQDTHCCMQLEEAQDTERGHMWCSARLPQLRPQLKSGINHQTGKWMKSQATPAPTFQSFDWAQTVWSRH